VITDTANWTLVSGSFVADSAYRYIVLGNFFDDAHTDTVHFIPGPSAAAYYLYDAICVSSVPGECPMSTAIMEQGQDGVVVQVTAGSEWLHVEGAETGFRIWVFDAGGRLVVQSAINGPIVQDIRDWPDGMYVARILGRKGEGWSKKFVVMR
jgi:hypothetical protein